MAKQKLSYDEAQKELEQILFELETDKTINMDSISVKVKRAAELLEFCKNQLHQIDKDLEKIMQQID